MSRGYLARLVVWALIVLGIGWLVGQWLAQDRPPFPPPAPRVVVAPPVPSSASTTDPLAFLSRTANRWLMWAAENWLFLGQIGLIFAVGWGAFGRGLGAYDLIFAEQAGVRLVNGLLIGLLFGEILWVQYLSTREAIPWPVASSPSVLALSAGSAEEVESVRRGGNFLLWVWLPVLLVFYAPGLLAYRAAGRVPMLGSGLVFAPILAVGCVHAGWEFGPRVANDWFANTPGAIAGVIAPADFPLHLIGLFGLMISAVGLAVCALASLGGWVACPVWVIALLIWFLNGIYGLILFHFTGLQYILIGLGLILAYVANVGHPFKLRLPNLGPEYAAARGGAVDVARLGETPSQLRPVALTSGDEFLKRFREQHRQTGARGRPKLIVAAVSGGGTRAAVWTAAVLEMLEARLGATFAQQLRLVTGASGGMVGAGLYAAAKVRAVAGPSLAHRVGQDSLWPLMQTFLTVDLPGVFWPFHRNWDRGQTLEQTWHRNAPAAAAGLKSPWSLTFAELQAAESSGVAPALIFSPLLVEDGRRLLISNLDLRDLSETFVPTFGPGGGAKRVRTGVPAVEFFRLFPESHHRFTVSTAARLNATFPFVSPSVALPALPPRRVVDAGYFDNYGVGLLASWLYANRDAIRDYTSGVAILEVRAFPLEAEKNGFDGVAADGNSRAAHLESRATRLTTTMRSLTATAILRPTPPRPSEQADAGGSLVSVLAGISTPAEALLAVRSAGAYYRNDQSLSVLDAEFNPPGDDPFLVRAVLECPGDAALSWAITQADRDQIIGYTHALDGPDPAKIRPAVNALGRWLNGKST